jgi:hypothetical protein
MIGTEERKNRSDDGEGKLYNFTVVKGNIIQSIHIIYWNTVLCVVVW